MTSQGPGPAISAMLAVADVPTAVAWYQRALGATELWSLGSVAGMEIAVRPSSWASRRRTDGRSPPSSVPLPPGSKCFCDDPDALIARALEAGANGSLDDIKDHQMPWGTHKQGGFVDPFGHIWLVGDKSPLSRFPS